MKPDVFKVGVDDSTNEGPKIISVEADEFVKTELAGTEFLEFQREGAPVHYLKAAYVGSITPEFDGEDFIELEGFR